MGGVQFDIESAKKIAQVVRQSLGTLPSTGQLPRGAKNPATVIEFILGEDMATAGNPRTMWTTARAYIYKPDADGDLVYSNQQAVITNRYTGVSGEPGQYGTAARVNGRWLAQTLDCGVDEDWEAPEALSIDADPGPGDA